MSDERQIEPAAKLRGEVRVPGDKSASHRALMISALANGVSTIEGLSRGEDVSSTSTMLISMGAVREDRGDQIVITGPSDGLHVSKVSLDCGNSGTTIRLMSGIVSGIEGVHSLIGDASLSKRPMDRVADPLEMMGAKFSGQGEHITPPLQITGSTNLRGIDYHVPSASAQVKSAIIFAGLRASQPSTVHEDVRTRSATEDMLRHAGVQIDSHDVGLGRSVTVHPGRPRPSHWIVPGDPSQAAFFAVLGLVHPNAEIKVRSIDTSPERIGFISVLQRMGGSLTIDESGVKASTSKLNGTEIHASEIPSVDEVPALSVAAAAATGVTSFLEMGELRLKESDRFEGSMRIASLLGCKVWSEGDNFFIEGLGDALLFQEFSIDSGLDHRIVMSSAVAAIAGDGGVITGASTVASSYPNFFEHLDSLR